MAAGVAGVAGGLLASGLAIKGLSAIDDTFNITKGTKEIAVKSIKTILDGMKNFGKTLWKVFG